MPKYVDSISQAFVDSYRGKTPPWGPVGYCVYKRTYSRKIPEENRTEEWWETIQRCCNGLIGIGGKFTQAEIQTLYDMVFNLKCNFSGRALWQLGTKTVDDLGADSLQNCWSLAVADPVEAFCFTFDELMLGGGVGFNIQREFVYEMPKIKYDVKVIRRDEKDVDFIVPDNREGWVDLLRRTLTAFYYTGKSFDYSTICVRGKGAPIKGFGGTASGPEDLCDGIEQISKILRGRVGKKLRPIDCLDIMNIIGSVVVAGNVRRSAQIALGDMDDRQYLDAKNWGKGTIPNWRSMSNNSIICNDIEHLPTKFWSGYNGEGEPYGLVNLKNCQTFGRIKDGKGYRPDKDVTGVNPCVPADTWIMTSGGPKLVKDLIGTRFEALINGIPYDTTDLGFFSSGVKPLVKIQTKEGYSLRLTPDHKVKRAKVTVKKRHEEWVEAKNLVPGDLLCLHNHRGAEWEGIGTHEEGYLLGFLVGDGTFSDSVARLDFYGVEKYAIGTKCTSRMKYVRNKDFPLNVREKKSSIHSADLMRLAESFGIRPIEKKLGKLIEQTSSEFYEGFLSGFFDADGSAQGDHKKGASVRLGQSNVPRLKAVQRMLLRLGIASTIYYDRHPEGFRLMPDGKGGPGQYYCEATHELSISNDNMFEFRHRIGLEHPDRAGILDVILSSYKRKPNRERFVATVESIDTDGIEEVFDVQVPGPCEFDANGFEIRNCGEIPLASYESCNLAEIYLPSLKDEAEFMEAAGLLCKVTKTISCVPFIHNKTTEVVSRNHRLGIGVTGLLQAEHLRDEKIFENVYRHIEEIDKKYSKVLGVKPSIKLTTCKPSGTLSLLPGCTPGVHPAYAPYYIRRIRMASTDPLVDKCRQHGFHVEPVVKFDGTHDHGTMVVSFPIKSPEGAIVAESVSAVQQMEWANWLQTHWADNSVSVTVYYKKEELPEIKAWLKDNYNQRVKTISFLLHSDHGFAQAPLDPIDEEEYEKLIASTKPITSVDDDRQREFADSLECSGGACPVK